LNEKERALEALAKLYDPPTDLKDWKKLVREALDDPEFRWRLMEVADVKKLDEL
jgi:hypothetical protein